MTQSKGKQKDDNNDDEKKKKNLCQTMPSLIKKPQINQERMEEQHEEEPK